FPRSGRPAQRPSGPGVAQLLRGSPDAAAFEAKHPGDALRQLAGLDVRQLELSSFAGEPIYLATLAGGATRIVPVHGEPLETFDHDWIVAAIAPAGGGRMETRLLTQYDWYYLDRNRQRPLPVVLALMHDDEQTR